jgi:predicted phage terminase large subunit-like protein
MVTKLEMHEYSVKIAQTLAMNKDERNRVFSKWCKNDLYFLMRYGMDRPFMEHPWFFARCREVEANPDGYLDLWAREHGKSLTITIGKTIQDILINPEITIGIFSHTRPIAKSFLSVIKREFENNEKLKDWFCDVLYDNPEKQSDKWSLDAGIIVKRKSNPPECTVEAHGLVDGMPTGRHFQLRVYDDVVTGDSVSTAEQMQKTIDALDMSNNLGKIGGKRRMIGTRYKKNDAYEDYIKRGSVIPRIYPATDNGRADGNPVFFTEEQWEDKLQDMSPPIIASQMLQNPLAEDAVIFQPDWFQMWPADKELPVFDAVFQSFDGAFSEKNTADFSCLLTLGVWKANEGSPKFSVMILDCWMQQASYPKQRDEVIRQYGNKYGKNDAMVNAVIVEDKASGSALIPELRKAGIPVYPYQPGNLDKTARANLISHLVRDGYVWVPESRKRKGCVMSWLGDAYEQWLFFPNVRNDDAVDALVAGLSVMNKQGFLRGSSAPSREISYWRRLMNAGSYSGDAVVKNISA